MQALQLITTLALLIILHELGHFTFAKLSKTRVDKFYLFFDPWFSLFKIKKGETEYGIGWLPLGGYCKIAGMVDESLDKGQLASEPKPWEYRSKPWIQRFMIIIGGVLFNFLTAIIIYSALSFAFGKTYLPLQNLEYGVYCDSTAHSIGFENGDKIIFVDDKQPKTLSNAVSQILLDDAKTVTVERNGREIQINIPEDIGKRILANPNSFFLIENFPFVIDSIMPNTPASRSNLRVEDRIVAIDSITTLSFMDFAKTVKPFAGKDVVLTVVRHGFEEKIPITISEEGKIGAYTKTAYDLFETVTEKYSLLQSIPEGIKMGFNTLTFYVKQFKLVFTKEGSQQVGTFVSMGKMYDKEWNWRQFWSLAALFSVILAFMNILPIPGLDGGHLLFLLVELIIRRKPSEKVLIKAQMIGMAIIFAIFFYALFLDFGRLF
ncbi:MAG: RIP metalloprotease RseP [Bacteroidales bacterium]|nr:RIP metalloprotease RseP [Bacteroidales bacterium]